VIYLIQFPLGT